MTETQRQWKKNHPEAVKKSYAKWYNTKGREYHRNWDRNHPESVKASKAKWLTKATEYARKWRASNPEKIKAYDAFYWAIDTGKIFRQPCSRCGSSNAEAHHENYNKPLEVIWLCRLHHMEQHRRKLK